MKRKHRMHRVKVVFTVLLLAISIFVYDLIAKEAPTELEMYQDIFSQTDSVKPASGTAGSALLLQPVEKVKKNTEEYVLRRKGVITHDEMEGAIRNEREMFKQRSNGPKISLTF